MVSKSGPSQGSGACCGQSETREGTMGLSLVTPPTLEPVTIDEALAQCRISSDTENGLIAGYILAARQYAEKVTRQQLMQQTYDFTVDFHWPFIRQENPAYFIMPFFFFRTRIELPVSPLLQVQWMKYTDETGNVVTLDPSQYIVIANEPTPYIEPAYGVSWPNTRWQPAAVQIRMDAGYGDSPSDIPENFRQAM